MKVITKAKFIQQEIDSILFDSAEFKALPEENKRDLYKANDAFKTFVDNLPTSEHSKLDAAHIREAARVYEEEGATGVYTYANKLKFPYGYCKGCAEETPKVCEQCLICGQVTK